MQTATNVTLVPGSDAWRQLYTSTKVRDLVNGRALKVFNTWFGITPPTPDNERMKWGRRIERVIIDAAAEEKGWKRLAFPGTVVSKENPLLATTADFAAEDTIAGEAKNRGQDQAHRYEDGEATEDEVMQCQWHAGILGLPRCAVAVLIGGNDLRVFEFPADGELFEGAVEIAMKFHRDHILTQRPPPLDSSDDATAYLKARFPRNTRPLLVADDATTNLAMNLRLARQEREAVEAREKEIENALKGLIGEAEGVYGPGWKATWKATKATRKVDWEAVAIEAGASAELVRRFTEERPGARRFLLTFKEG